MSPRPAAPLTLEFILLGLLDARPAHGYDLHKQLSGDSPLAMLWQVKQSQLYALLDKLEAHGLVRSQPLLEEYTPPRKQYDLTPLGRERLYAWRSAPVEHVRDLRQEFLARLYFARCAGDETARGLIAAQTQRCQVWAGRLEARLNAEAPEAHFPRSVHAFRLHQVRAALAWLTELEGELG